MAGKSQGAPRAGKETTSILALYLSYHNQYVEKYGEKTVVLCQVGDFFEVYAVINDKEERGPNIYRVADILGIQVTRRNKSILEVSDSNYLMSGFPLNGIQKHIQTLVSNSYTVVLVRQVSPPPHVNREVTEIISPSMTLSPTTTDPNYLVVIMASLHNKLWRCGVSAVDVSTGNSVIYEVGSTLEDPSNALDELVRVLHTCPSREIVLISQNIPTNRRQELEDAIGVHRSMAGFHPIYNNFPDCFQDRAYQEAILAKAGIGRGILSAHSISGMDDMPLASIAMCYMIQFAYEHNPKLISRLQAPHVMTQKNLLVLQYNSAQQLNILGRGMPNETPLLSILNRTVTTFGGRLFRDRMLNPITCCSALQKRYDMVDYYLQDDMYLRVRKHLKGILDLERMVRRMAAETFAPCDWASLHMSLLEALEATELIPDSRAVAEAIRKMVEAYSSVLELEEASKYQLQDIRGNIFRTGTYPDLDNLTHTVEENLEIIKEIVKILSNNDDSRLCKVDFNERDGYYLTTTKKRWGCVQKAMNVSAYTAKPISKDSNTYRITSTTIEQASNTITVTQQKIASLTQERYIIFLNSYSKHYTENVMLTAHFLADADVLSTNAMNAKEFGYTRPELVQSQDGSASMTAQQLRHPIIERIHKRVDYIANNMSLDRNQQGLLLYGVNASGKSSLMKAIGLAIIMAQSGMYVPCSSLVLSPYSSLFTRISGDDNLYQGMSSFAVEMTELRNILARANSGSLVLGDELCSGTEAVSAVSIVAAGIGMLLERGATYVFATHLHELLDIPDVSQYTKNDRLQIKHMHTEVRDGVIIYDRTLRDGAGESTYGIEVCRGLGMSKGFMAFAEKIRRHVENEDEGFVRQKQSRYNPRVRMDVCGVCRVEMATETHHIRYQQSADECGFIRDTHSHIHKNEASNLVPLCEKCHTAEHRGAISIHGWKQTSEGVELVYITTAETMREADANIKAQKGDSKSMEEIVTIWKPYLRYTRNGWMVRKKNTLNTKFKKVPLENLIKTLRSIQAVPTCLTPCLEDVERLQTALLDNSL